MQTMNALLARIQSVREAGDSYKDANLYKNKKDDIEGAFMPQWNALKTRHAGILAARRDMSAACPVALDFTQMKASLEKLKRQVQRDTFDKDAVTPLLQEATRMDLELQKGWKAYVTKKTGAIAGILETLDTLIADMPEKRTLDRSRLIFSAAKVGNPAAFEAIEEYVSAYTVLMDKLGLGEDVLAFLKLLTSGQTVTLRSLSDDVYQWLRGSSFADKIIISVKTNAKL